MKAEVKAAWVKALRSGEYEQGKNALRNGDQYCCLGVLCELAVKAGAIQPATDNNTGHYMYDEEGAFLPQSVLSWADLADDYDHDADILSDLIGYNDQGKPFTYIADTIEAKL